MFSPEGYVSLAALWKEFAAKKGNQIANIARQKYQEDDFSPVLEFGSPADFFEEVFLRSLDEFTVSLCSLDGTVTNLRPEISDPFSNLFQRATVFESTLIAQNLEEAGPRDFWLHQMGSGYFKLWPELQGKSELWARAYVTGETRSRDVRQLPFHTLPYCFERFKFTVPAKLPPWCEDAIDEVYVHKTVPDFLGQAICLDESQAQEWRLKNVRKSEWKIALGFEAPGKVGRSRKQELARTYYFEMFPNGHQGTWQAACNEILARFRFEVSVKTLKRSLDAKK